MKNKFDKILNTYTEDYNIKVDSSSEAYKLICNEIPLFLKGFFHRNDFKVNGSIGKGNRTKYPWISILNTNITTSTQEGLYIGYLFKKDMSGFHISLLQGITHFERRFGRKKYEYIKIIGDYFRSELDDMDEMEDFSCEAIDIGATSRDLGYGYQEANIISKLYLKDQFTKEELENDLNRMVKLYDFIYKHMESNYDDIVDSILAEYEDDFLDADEAKFIIKEVENEIRFRRYDEDITLIEVSPQEEKTNKFKKFRRESTLKKDYIKKQTEDAKTGLIGEELALEFERNRLESIGIVDRLPKWVAKESDSYGYDILSYDYDENHQIKEIYIEVKSSTSRVDVDFYVSRNEYMTSKENGLNYFIYRIYDIDAKNPKIYRANGPIDLNFDLEPFTYKASYKWKVS